MPPKRAINEPADVADKPTARKRSRSGNNGERLPIMKVPTARTSKKFSDDKERKERRKAEAQIQRNETRKARAAGKARKEEARDRRREEDDVAVAMDEAALQLSEGAHTKAAAALMALLGAIITLGEVEAGAEVTSAVEQELAFEGVEGVFVEGM